MPKTLNVDAGVNHISYMRRCLQLARLGKGATGKNPMVGCVIVHNDRIIGEGYHMFFGGPHAEVNAVGSVKDKKQLKESTMYVNLEPCSHFGKTPPCSILVKEMGIPEVIIGSLDPNPDVFGKGAGYLKKAGIRVTTGILEQECIQLNRKFFVNKKLNRPYVILKWAESRDGFIDIIRKPDSPVEPTWITNHTARKLVHKWRGEEESILAGVNTILADNPSLDLRDWSGNQPVRISIDRKGRIDESFKILDGKRNTIIFTEALGKQNNAVYQKIQKGFGLHDLLGELNKMGISSVIVEGGSSILTSFINEDLWDEARVFKGNMDFREGVRAPVLEIDADETILYRNNLLSIFFHQINDLLSLS